MPWRDGEDSSYQPSASGLTAGASDSEGETGQGRRRGGRGVAVSSGGKGGDPDWQAQPTPGRVAAAGRSRARARRGARSSRRAGPWWAGRAGAPAASAARGPAASGGRSEGVGGRGKSPQPSAEAERAGASEAEGEEPAAAALAGAKRRKRDNEPQAAVPGQAALPADSCALDPARKSNTPAWRFHATDASVSCTLSRTCVLSMARAKPGAHLPKAADVLGLDFDKLTPIHLRLEGSEELLPQNLCYSSAGGNYRMQGGNFARLLQQAGAGPGSEVRLRRELHAPPGALPLLVLRIGGAGGLGGEEQQGENEAAARHKNEPILTSPEGRQERELEQGGEELQQQGDGVEQARTAAAAAEEGQPAVATAAQQAQQAQQAQPEVPWQLRAEPGALTTPQAGAAEQAQQLAPAASPNNASQRAAMEQQPPGALLTLSQQAMGLGGSGAPGAATALALPGRVPPALDTLSEVLELLSAGGLPQEEAGGVGLRWLNTPDAQRCALLGMAREAVQHGASGSAAANGARAAADILSCSDEEFQLQQALAASGLDLPLLAQLRAAWLQPLPPAVRCSVRRALLRPWVAAGTPAAGHKGAAGAAGAAMPAWAADVHDLAGAVLRSLQLAAAGAADLHARLCEMQAWIEFEEPRPDPGLVTRFEVLWLLLSSRQQRDGVHRLVGLNCGAGRLAAALKLVAPHMERGAS